jgi:hypothetical protein
MAGFLAHASSCGYLPSRISPVVIQNAITALRIYSDEFAQAFNLFPFYPLLPQYYADRGTINYHYSVAQNKY